MREIDLMELLRECLKKWWIILICAAFLGGAATVYSYFYLVPVYQSYTTIYVGRTAGMNESLTLSQELNIGSAVIDDYREIVKSKQVASEVIRQLGMESMSPSSIAGRIQVAQKNKTRVIQITVTDADPQAAMNIANTVAAVFQRKVIEIMQVDNVQIIDRAELPRYPISPNKPRNVMIGLLGGGLLGIGIILLILFLDNTVKTPEDVQKYYKLPVIGTIPRFQKLIKGISKNKEKSVILISNPKSPISEAYRVLRTNIQYSSFDKRLKTFVVTSAGPMEGKSTTIINLAVAFSQAGNRVLLIDTDLRKPSIHNMFGFYDDKGLTNYHALHKEGDNSEYKIFLHSSEISNMDIMTCGIIPPNPSELLSSNAMKNFVDMVSKDYDMVFFDAPPIGSVTDAAIISTYVDGTILVVSSGTARIDAVQRAKELLDKVNANNVGVVLNKLEKSANRSYYSSHYYYKDKGIKTKKHSKRGTEEKTRNG